MRKLFFVGVLLVAMCAGAQVVDLQRVERLPLAENVNQKVAGISPDGSFILLTSQSNVGLTQYVLATGETSVISQADGAGYQPQVQADNQSITYREVSYNRDNLRMITTKQMNLQSKKNMTLQRAARQPRVLNPSLEVSIVDRQLVLSVAGHQRVLSPNGQQFSYIWPSISPDKQHILYYVGGVGAYVCDLQGQHVQFLGHDLRAPKWLDNQTIVAMDDRDNGEYITSSSIVVVNMQGERQVLTDSSLMLMYPQPSADGKTIISSAVNGDIYRITLR